MRIDQRNSGSAVTLTNSVFTYGVDRWAAYVSTSTSTVTTQRVASGVASFPYVTRILRGSGTFTGSSVLMQEIETVNCQDLAGQTVTVSFWARKGSAASQTSFYIQGISGSGTDQGIVGANNGTWTGWAAPVLGVPTLTTTLTQYSYTWTVPAGTNEMAVYFVVNTYTGTGSANDYIDITGIQLEAGSVATPFERRHYTQELSLCQRYCYKTTVGNGTYGYFPGSGACDSTTTAQVVIQFPVPMRSYASNLSLTTTGTSSHYSLYVAGSIRTLSAGPTLGTSQSTNDACQLTCTVGSAVLVAGQAAQLLGTVANAPYLLFTTEL
jgi:hypothetical protein